MMSRLEQPCEPELMQTLRKELRPEVMLALFPIHITTVRDCGHVLLSLSRSHITKRCLQLQWPVGVNSRRGHRMRV